MRPSLKMFATVVIIISIPVLAIGVVAFFNDGQSLANYNLLLAAVGAGMMIGAGLLWTLCEISEQIAELPEDLRSIPASLADPEALKNWSPPKGVLSVESDAALQQKPQ